MYMYNIETQESDILSINAEYSSKRGRNAGEISLFFFPQILNYIQQILIHFPTPVIEIRCLWCKTKTNQKHL